MKKLEISFSVRVIFILALFLVVITIAILGITIQHQALKQHKMMFERTLPLNAKSEKEFAY